MLGGVKKKYIYIKKRNLKRAFKSQGAGDYSDGAWATARFFCDVDEL